MAGLIGSRTEKSALDEMEEVARQFNEDVAEEERKQAEEERLKREREKLTAKASPAIEKPVEVRPVYPEGKYPDVNTLLGTIEKTLRDDKPWILNGPMFPDANYIKGAYTPAPNALMAIAYLLNGEEKKAIELEQELQLGLSLESNGFYIYSDGWKSLDARRKGIEDNASVAAMEAYMGRRLKSKESIKLAKIMMKKVKSKQLMGRKWFGEMRGLYPTHIHDNDWPDTAEQYDMRINAYMALAEAFSGNNRKAKGLVKAIERAFPCEDDSIFARRINGVGYKRYANENAAMAVLYAMYEPDKAERLIMNMKGCMLDSGLFMEEAGHNNKFRTADNALVAIASAILNGAMIEEKESIGSIVTGVAYGMMEMRR